MADFDEPGPGGALGSVEPAQASEAPVSADAGITQLYRSHYDAMVRLAVVLMKATSRADEIVQDAFVELHQRWAAIGDQSKAAAYLRRSVVNRCTSAHRHLNVVDRHVGQAGARLHDAPSAESLAITHDTQDRVLAALDQLPEQQRTVMVLRYFSGLSESEIADTMQIAPGSVKSHASRAARALRASLEGLR